MAWAYSEDFDPHISPFWSCLCSGIFTETLLCQQLGSSRDHSCRNLRRNICWILTVPSNGRVSFARAFRSIVSGMLCKASAIRSLRDGASPWHVFCSLTYFHSRCSIINLPAHTQACIGGKRLIFAISVGVCWNTSTKRPLPPAPLHVL